MIDSEVRPEPLVRELQRENTLATRVANELERLIVENHLETDARLPSERDLASQFGVSRTVVREAVRALAAKGLLSVENGRGTVVLRPSAQSAAESMKLLLRMQPGGFDYEKVVEIRRILEVEMASLAAARRSEDDLARMEVILDTARRSLANPDAFVAEDLAFHRALGIATQNELFVVILDSINGILIEGRRLALRIPGTPARSVAYHQRICDAVRRGDVAGARAAMDRHMDEARDTLNRAVAGDPGS